MPDKRPQGETDRDDKRQASLIIAAIAILFILLLLCTFLLVPAAGDVIASQFSPGVGLRQAAVIAFFVSVILFIVFAIVAGDGLLGELQFMLAAFLGFFLICWFMVAWIF